MAEDFVADDSTRVEIAEPVLDGRDETRLSREPKSSGESITAAAFPFWVMTSGRLLPRSPRIFSERWALQLADGNDVLRDLEGRPWHCLQTCPWVSIWSTEVVSTAA